MTFLKSQAKTKETTIVVTGSFRVNLQCNKTVMNKTRRGVPCSCAIDIMWKNLLHCMNGAFKLLALSIS